ncbi:hypothetical protein DYI24_16020 [Rhodopseudomonas sp. BR0C11]|uniref:hypothetical protein n=1 Tax=Rhodopseudomonas sp. BR0C11 TaxID=2269370 RepID=UPI0013E03977|nr:hypothetical protein [Rhodopseudomonas sp. BR0C11]NEV78548.1 hypothetical protein [Rhodopseudomonas sp. BR0C11]
MFSLFPFPARILPLNEFIAKHRLIGEELKADPLIADLHRMYHLIDAKCGALLTHVSLMIAAVGLFCGNSALDGALRAVVVCYLLVAVVLLGCLGLSMYESPPECTVTSEMLASFERERRQEFFSRSCRQRGLIFLACLSSTILITIFVILVLLIGDNRVAL